MRAYMPKPKSARERREETRLLKNTEDTTALMLMLFALALNKRRHFGEKRLEETFNDVFDLLDEYTEKYDSDCVVFALQKHLAERKIHIEIEGRGKKK
jgi:hypothetical protein